MKGETAKNAWILINIFQLHATFHTDYDKEQLKSDIKDRGINVKKLKNQLLSEFSNLNQQPKP